MITLTTDDVLKSFAAASVLIAGGFVAGFIAFQRTITESQCKPFFSDEELSLSLPVPNRLLKLLKKKNSELSDAEYYRVASYVGARGEALITANLKAWIEVSKLRASDRCVAVDILTGDHAFAETYAGAADALKERAAPIQIYVANVERRLADFRQSASFFEEESEYTNSAQAPAVAAEVTV